MWGQPQNFNLSLAQSRTSRDQSTALIIRKDPQIPGLQTLNPRRAASLASLRQDTSIFPPRLVDRTRTRIIPRRGIRGQSVALSLSVPLLA